MPEQSTAHPNVIQSRIAEGSVSCPECGHTGEAVMWELLEADCNPERAAQLARGDLLVHTCARCGALLPLDYPLFYVDRTRGVAAYYPAGQGERPALETLFAQAHQRFRGVDLSLLRKHGVAMRLVPTRYGLVEKTAAWLAGLDDELLELFKASLLSELQRRNPERGFRDIQFTGLAGAATLPAPDKDGNAGDEQGVRLSFALFAEEADSDGARRAVPAGSGVSVPVEAYRRLERSADVRRQIDAYRSPVVDAAWAREVLAALEG